MKKFLDKFEPLINGVLSGFDRIIIKGHLTDFYVNNTFYFFLNQEKVLLKDFKPYVLQITEDLKNHVKQVIEKTGCYSEYLTSAKTKKEKIAQRIQHENPNKEGLLCILSDVEPCHALTVKWNEVTHKLEKKNEFRKCLHYYFYYNDRDLGLMHVRFQTWFPFEIQIYINGKEYLKKQLTKEGISFTAYDNSVTAVSDLNRAQEIADAFADKKWYAVFDHFAKQVNSFLPHIQQLLNSHGYTWCIEQCEYASDILFKDRATLETVYPHFLEYASLCQMGENIFTFFGRKVHGLYQGEAVSDRKNYFGQGFRVKFTLDKNFLKMYDKSNVLRIETTINNAHAFKILNPNPQGKTKWLPMGKSISNLYRYAEITKKCNERYLDSLAASNQIKNIDKDVENLCHTQKTKLSEKSVKERSFAAINPLQNFMCLAFNAMMDGAYAIKGFSTKLLTERLIELKAFTKDQIANITKLKAKIGRLIAKFRAHKLVTKLPGTFRYRVNKNGEEILCRILMFKKLDLNFAKITKFF